MKIALDYDQTYTADPNFWDDFIQLAKAYDHEVNIVTKRGVDNQGETVPPYVNVPVVYSNRKAKFKFAQDQGLQYDIWIDDSPINLFVEG